MAWTSGLQIRVTSGNDTGRVIPLNAPEITLGRAVESSENSPSWVLFTEPTVSRIHALLQWSEEHRAYLLHHRSRTNPTLVNGAPVDIHLLSFGECVGLGLLEFVIEPCEQRSGKLGDAVQAPAGSSDISIPVINALKGVSNDNNREENASIAGLVDASTNASAKNGLRLMVAQGPDQGRTFTLTEPVLVIGRLQGPNDQRASAGVLLHDLSIPVEQALLVWQDRAATYGILQSDNSNVPTRIRRISNGIPQDIKVRCDIPTVLYEKDVIKIGKTSLILRQGEENAHGVTHQLNSSQGYPAQQDYSEELAATRPPLHRWSSEDGGSQSGGVPHRPGRKRAYPVYSQQPDRQVQQHNDYDNQTFEQDDYALQGGYPQQGGYQQQGGYTQGGYPQQSGYQQQGGYTPQGPFSGRYEDSEDYAQSSGYSQQSSYPQQNGYPQQQSSYPQQGGYPPQNGYPQQGGYSQQGGYPQQNAYPQQEGYPQQSGYQQPGGYPQQSSYQQPGVYQQQGGYPQQGGYQQQNNYPNDGSSVNSVGYQNNYFDEEGSFANNAYPQQAEQQDMNQAPSALDFSDDLRAAQEPPQPFGQQSPQPRAPYSPFVRRPEGRSNRTRQRSQSYPLIADQNDPKVNQVVIPPQSAQPRGPELPSNTPNNAKGVIITNSPDEFPEIELAASRSEDGQTVTYRADYVFSCIQGSRQGEKVAILASCLTEERTLTIGSPGERNNDIEVDDPSIANDHAIINYRNGRFSLTNFRTEISVNQTPLIEGDVIVLQTGDRINLGNSVVLFQERRVVELLRDYSIEVCEGIDSDMGKTFPLTRERMTIGRDRNADINLTDPGVAREHCLLLVRGNKLYIQHRSDTNSTSVGEWELKPGAERQISTEDRIRLSNKTVLQLRRSSSDSAA